MAAKVRERVPRACPSSSTSTIAAATTGRRLRIAIDQDNLEYFTGRARATSTTRSQSLYGGTTVGYSHRGGGRQPIPIRIGLPKGDRTLDERALATPVPANALPGDRGVVELGDVVRVSREPASFPIFRHNGRAAEMVTAELAGGFEAPIYGMLAVGDAIDAPDWGGLPKPGDRAARPAGRRDASRRCCGTANGRSPG